MYSLSGYGFMDIGLPPASPSEKDIDLKVYGILIYFNIYYKTKKWSCELKGQCPKHLFHLLTGSHES